MKIQASVVVVAAVLVILGGIAGFTLRGCTNPPVRTVQTVVHDTMRSNVDSIRAVSFLAGRAEAHTIIQRRDVDHILEVPDSLSIMRADSLLRAIDSLLDARAQDLELVATGYTKTATYELSEIFRFRDRTFGHVLNITHADTLTEAPPCPEPKTFWENVRDLGLAGVIGVIIGLVFMAAHK